MTASNDLIANDNFVARLQRDDPEAKWELSLIFHTASEAPALRAHKAAASNLLAVIHRDGGHYQDEHGFVKACADAETITVAYLADKAALVEALDATIYLLDEAAKLIRPSRPSFADNVIRQANTEARATLAKHGGDK